MQQCCANTTGLASQQEGDLPRALALPAGKVNKVTAEPLWPQYIVSGTKSERNIQWNTGKSWQTALSSAAPDFSRKVVLARCGTAGKWECEAFAPILAFWGIGAVEPGARCFGEQPGGQVSFFCVVLGNKGY